MITFQQMYTLLYETPDKCAGRAWKTPDSVAFGVVGTVPIVVPQGTHSDIYNNLYFSFITDNVDDRTAKVNLRLCNIHILSDIAAARPVITQRLKNIPWTVVNLKQRNNDTGAEILRTEFFEACGRLWKKSKTASFWDVMRNNLRYIPQLKEIWKYCKEDITQYRFEFPEHNGKFITWEEFSGEHPTPPSSNNEQNVKSLQRMQHLVPDAKKILGAKPGSEKMGERATLQGFNTPAAYAAAMTTGG